MILKTLFLDELENIHWPPFVRTGPIICGPEEHDQGEIGDSDTGD